MLVSELKISETDVVRTAILSLINALILCAGNISKRALIRTEFVGKHPCEIYFRLFLRS